MSEIEAAVVGARRPSRVLLVPSFCLEFVLSCCLCYTWVLCLLSCVVFVIPGSFASFVLCCLCFIWVHCLFHILSCPFFCLEFVFFLSCLTLVCPIHVSYSLYSLLSSCLGFGPIPLSLSNFCLCCALSESCLLPFVLSCFV
jgi:hypothetical protein